MLNPKIKTAVEAAYLQLGASNIDWAKLQLNLLTGGDINQVYKLQYAQLPSLCLKRSKLSSEASSFQREALSLKCLDLAWPRHCPKVYAQGEDFLLIEYLGASRSPVTRKLWEELAQGLYQIHHKSKDIWEARPRGSDYGFSIDKYAPQKFDRALTWPEFFWQYRLEPVLEAVKNRLSKQELGWAESINKRLPSMLGTAVYPSLLHGDLWSGNYHIARNQKAYLIDPASYYGHYETDLAFTELFGGFSRVFYEHYYSLKQREPGYDTRRDLYNLYHLVNHLRLFGEVYHSSVSSILKKYA